MASGLSKRATAIEDAIALLGHLHDRLRYLQPTMGALMQSAAGVELHGAGYIAACSSAMARGTAFPQAWREALAMSPGALRKEEAELMAALGGVLGATDLNSQLTALRYTREQMERRLDLARENCGKYQKLYSTLGVLAGLAIAIILI